MAFLLDVNALIALIDPDHEHHDITHHWFQSYSASGWATCPITQNGVVRIVGHRNYINTPGTPGAVVDLMSRLCDHPGHTFWPNDISLLDRRWIDADRLLTSGQVTDSYLLALAVSKGGQLATLDRRLVTTAVTDGVKGLHLIQTAS